MSTTIETLTGDLQRLLTESRDIADACEKENRDFTDAERADMQAKLAAAKDVKAKIEARNADDALRSAIGELGEGVDLNPASNGKQASRPSGLITPEPGMSIGQHFVSSDAYKSLLSSAPNGQFGEKMRVQSAPVGFKTLVTGSDRESAGALVQHDWRGLLGGLEQFQRPLRLRDVVTSGTTGSDTVEYARITSINNAAAPVPEATETTGTSGTKPESGFATGRYTTTVKTIAHWLPVTKRALSDAAQVRTIIDAFLQYGLEETLEEEMISGDGSGEHFEGLIHTSGVQQQPYQGEESDINLLRTLRKAKTLVRTVGRAVPNAYLLNPEDVERVDLTVDGHNRFYFSGPYQSDQIQPLWGLPVVETEAVPPGIGYVGDWTKAILWDREQASITATDSHADFFIRNLVAILAELRAAFGIVQPNAFVEIELDGSGS